METDEWNNEHMLLLIELIKANTPFEVLPMFLNKDEDFIKDRIKESYQVLTRVCNIKLNDIKSYIGDTNNAFNMIIPRITGKRVLIIDFETTGLVTNKKNFYKYTDNKIYDECRIIEIGYYYSVNFDPNVDNITIHNYLRKPTDFTSITPGAQAVHGISYEKIMNEGIEFKTILDTKLLNVLNNTDIFISHNTSFDFYVLLNELYRLKYWPTIKRLTGLRTNKNILCTCRASGFKKLTKMYNDVFNENPLNAHRAGDDVKTLLEILLKRKFVENKCNYVTNL